MTRMLDRIIYGNTCGWIFYPYENDGIYRQTIENNEAIDMVYLQWKNAMVNGLNGELLPIEGAALWPGLSISRTPDEIRQQEFRQKPTIKKQVERFTPQLQGYVFGAERTDVVVAAIGSEHGADIDLIVTRSHDYFTGNGIAFTQYAFIRENARFPLLYRIRSKNVKLK